MGHIRATSTCRTGATWTATSISRLLREYNWHTCTIGCDWTILWVNLLLCERRDPGLGALLDDEWGGGGIRGPREWCIYYWRTGGRVPGQAGNSCWAMRCAASQGVDMAVGDVFINNGISKFTLNLDTCSTNQTGGSRMGSGSALHRGIRPLKFTWFNFNL